MLSNSELVLGAMCLGCLVCLGVIVYRFTTIQSRMVEYQSRSNERSEMQRDRLVAIMFEKRQVEATDDEGNIMTMASMHAGESQRNMAVNLQRDHAADAKEIKKKRRAVQREAQHREEDGRGNSAKDALT